MADGPVSVVRFVVRVRRGQEGIPAGEAPMEPAAGSEVSLRARPLMPIERMDVLLLTGERSGLRTKVIYHQQDIWLTDEPFAALCRLAANSNRAQRGRRESPVTICRLRAAFDDVCGLGTGAKLIETLPEGRYQLDSRAGQIVCAECLWRRLNTQRAMWRVVASLKRWSLKSARQRESNH